MQFAESFKETIFTINDQNFESYCLEVFNYQYSECSVYNQYCNYLKKNPNTVNKVYEIPFLPIEFFKNHAIKTGQWKEEKIFKSSGTTQTGRSQHHVRSLSFYHSVSKKIFEEYFGELASVELIALLPSYQEMGDSSLIDMIDFFISNSLPNSGYSLNNWDDLIERLGSTTKKKLLFGVSYALLDFAEKYNLNLDNIQFIETGGMKGRRKELTRTELHQKLKNSFNASGIHSEYGMTELMSQAYGFDGDFKFPNWVKVLIRDINDPFVYQDRGKIGGINVVDLANIDTCSFIETKDLGKIHDKTFEVLGRLDNSDIRGCNLMF